MTTNDTYLHDERKWKQEMKFSIELKKPCEELLQVNKPIHRHKGAMHRSPFKWRNTQHIYSILTLGKRSKNLSNKDKYTSEELNMSTNKQFTDPFNIHLTIEDLHLSPPMMYSSRYMLPYVLDKGKYELSAKSMISVSSN